MMALSEDEKKMLEQIAQELERDDPKFASKMELNPSPAKARHVSLGILAALVGCLVLLTGIAARTPALGIIGFTIMGVGTYLATIRIVSLRIPRRPASSPSLGPAELG
jgi:F0F1-type ATP synthase assembly protein I